MSRADQTNRQLDSEEDRLSQAYTDGSISREDYNAEMRQLQRDAREAYAQDVEDAQQRVRDDWGY